MMAPKLRFSAVWSESARCRHCSSSGYAGHVSKCLQAHRMNTCVHSIFLQEATIVRAGTFFFFTFEGLSRVWLLLYERFDAALPLWSWSSSESRQVTRNVSLATILVLPWPKKEPSEKLIKPKHCSDIWYCMIWLDTRTGNVAELFRRVGAWLERRCNMCNRLVASESVKVTVETWSIMKTRKQASMLAVKLWTSSPLWWFGKKTNE